MMPARRLFAPFPAVCFAVLIAALRIPGVAARAQAAASPESGLTAARKADVVKILGDILEKQYVFPEKGLAMKALLQEKNQEGAYDALNDFQAFAQTLTRDLRSVVNDGHLRVSYNPDQVKAIRAAGSVSAEEREKQLKARLERERLSNFGYKRLEVLEGGVGYLDLLGFSGTRESGETAVAAMNFLAHCPAVIIDLRHNGGGSPFTIQLLSGYFLGESAHLNSFAWRGREEIVQFWSLPYVPGRMMAETDLYILTSRRTFSAAEEFTYNLKNLKRATIVGETTGGGAHPGGSRIIDDGFLVWVPQGRAINPITKTNWEGTGIEPHVAVPGEQALDKAHLLALEIIVSRTDDPQRKADLQWVMDALKVKTSPISVPLEVLKTYAGSYGGVKISFENGSLYALLDVNIPLTPLSETVFLAVTEGVRIEFIRDDKGQVVEAVSTTRNGQRQKHTRDREPSLEK
jgi:hypothetical protein